MQDLEFTMDNSESVKINFSEGKLYGCIFLVKEHDHRMAVAIEVESEEIFVIEILNGMQEIRITKDNR